MPRSVSKLYKVFFCDGVVVDVDSQEFGADQIGQTLDRLAVKHGGIVIIAPREG